MREALKTRPRPGAVTTTRGAVRDVVLIVLIWTLAIVTTAVFPAESPGVRRVALFTHLVSLVVGFGAVVTADTYGLLWIFGRRRAVELIRMVTAAHGLISAGLAGLLLSGVMLRPRLSDPLPRLKLLLVLAVMLNGLNAHRLVGRLRRLPDGVKGADIPWWCVPRTVLTAAISQVGWWGAFIIGFLTSMSRAGR
jgi:hypothetical protein